MLKLSSETLGSVRIIKATGPTVPGSLEALRAGVTKLLSALPVNNLVVLDLTQMNLSDGQKWAEYSSLRTLSTEFPNRYIQISPEGGDFSSLNEALTVLQSPHSAVQLLVRQLQAEQMAMKQELQNLKTSSGSLEQSRMQKKQARQVHSQLLRTLQKIESSLQDHSLTDEPVTAYENKVLRESRLQIEERWKMTLTKLSLPVLPSRVVP